MTRCLCLCGRTPCLAQKSTLHAESSRKVFKGTPVGVRVEHRLPFVQKTRRIDLDGSKDLDALALSCHWDLRLASDPRPGRVEGRVLPETGLVGKEESTPFRLGFYLWGRYVVANGPGRWHRREPRDVADVEQRSQWRPAVSIGTPDGTLRQTPPRLPDQS